MLVLTPFSHCESWTMLRCNVIFKIIAWHVATSHHGPTNNWCRCHRQALGKGLSNLHLKIHFNLNHLHCTNHIWVPSFRMDHWVFMPPWDSAVCSFWISSRLAHKRQKLRAIEYIPCCIQLSSRSIIRIVFFFFLFLKLLWNFKHSLQ